MKTIRTQKSLSSITTRGELFLAILSNPSRALLTNIGEAPKAIRRWFENLAKPPARLVKIGYGANLSAETVLISDRRKNLETNRIPHQSEHPFHAKMARGARNEVVSVSVLAREFKLSKVTLHAWRRIALEAG